MRLMTWCPHSVGGMHLPAFAASAGGLFAEHGLEVEYVRATSACEAIAAGDADFGLTSAVHVLTAHARAQRTLPVRFVATFHQRNPIVGVVRDDSGLRTPEDLAGARAARWGSPWYTVEYAGALEYLGLAAPVVVDTPGSLDHALGAGDVDVLPMWMDQTTPAKAMGMMLYDAGEGYDVRTIALDIPVYSTGLVAADRLPAEVVRGVRDAIAAGHELQRRERALGMAAFLRCFPEVTEQHAQVNWELYEPYAFDGVPPGGMQADRWRATIAYVSRTHGLASLPEEQVLRPELVRPASRALLRVEAELQRAAEHDVAVVGGRRADAVRACARGLAAVQRPGRHGAECFAHPSGRVVAHRSGRVGELGVTNRVADEAVAGAGAEVRARPHEGRGRGGIGRLRHAGVVRPAGNGAIDRAVSAASQVANVYGLHAFARLRFDVGDAPVAELGADDRAPLDDQAAALRACRRARDPQLVIASAAADERDRALLDRRVALDLRRAELRDLRLAAGRDVQAIDVTGSGVDGKRGARGVRAEVDVKWRTGPWRDPDGCWRRAADGLHQRVGRRGRIEMRPHDRALPGRDTSRSLLGGECRRRGLRRGGGREHGARDGDGDERCAC
ncbi:MAG: ABC transporter substrate-binding protein [Solirubrobacterales bacterium]|nr:ABC transporter substrate-binding protein [Solirubrobacterales bacterium]